MRPIFHKFGSKNINVYNILGVWYRERLFRIFNREFKYELSVEYKHQTTTLIPIYINSMVYFMPSTEYSQIDTIRYKYKDDLMNEYNKIILKCKHIGNNIKL